MEIVKNICSECSTVYGCYTVVRSPTKCCDCSYKMCSRTDLTVIYSHGYCSLECAFVQFSPELIARFKGEFDL